MAARDTPLATNLDLSFQPLLVARREGLCRRDGEFGISTVDDNLTTARANIGEQR